MATQQQEFSDFEINVNTTEVQEWGGEQRPLVPIGDYVATIVMVGNKPIGQNTPAVNITFEINEGGDGTQVGGKLFNNYPLTEAALGRMKNLQLACGASLDAIRASELMGAKIRLTVIHTESAGTPDANGNPRPARTFANVCNEAPYEEKPATKAAAAKPPITQAAPPAKPAATNGAARRQ